MWRSSLSFLLFPIILLSCSICLAQDTLHLSLNNCLQYAYGHNSTVQIAQLAVERAEVSLHGARWQFLPNINASAGEYWSKSNDQPSHDFSMGVNVSMTLFDGMSSWNNYRQSKLTLRQSQLQMQQSRHTVGEQVLNAYLTFLMTRERLGYQQHLLENCQLQLSEGLLRHEVGKMIDSEYQLLLANLQKAEKEEANLKLSIEESMLDLHVLLNLPDEVVLEIAPIDLTHCDTTISPIDMILQHALETQPDLSIAQMGVEIARFGVRSARAVYFPTLSLSIGSNYYGGNQGLVDGLGHIINQGGLNNNMGFNLSIPILNYSSAKSQVRQSKINLQQAEIELGQKSQEFRLQVKKMYVATQQALNNYLSAQQQEQAYRANYRDYQKRYNEGKVGTVELLQQQDSYLGALNDYLQSKYTFLLNMKLLELLQTSL